MVIVMVVVVAVVIITLVVIVIIKVVVVVLDERYLIVIVGFIDIVIQPISFYYGIHSTCCWFQYGTIVIIITNATAATYATTTSIEVFVNKTISIRSIIFVESIP